MSDYKWLPNTPSFDMLEGIEANIKPAVVSIYERMWRTAQEVEQEPFGYVRQSIDEDGFNCMDFYKSRHIGAIPVYTHPQTQREPLSGSEKQTVLSDEDKTALMKIIIKSILAQHPNGISAGVLEKEALKIFEIAMEFNK